VKEDRKYKALLSYFDTLSGVISIVNKLPPGLQGKWTQRAMKYKRTHCAAFPPFSVFCDFIEEMSTIKNDPTEAMSSCEGSVKQYTTFVKSVLRFQNQNAYGQKEISQEQ